MSIPLSKLININSLFEKLYGSRPFDQEVYEACRKYGDRMERGLPVAGKVALPDSVQRL